MRIGIDVRALTEKRAGIGTYVYEIIKNLNEIDRENEYYLYSNKKIVIDFKLNDNFKLCEKNCGKGTLFILFKIYKYLKQDKIDVFWGTNCCVPMKKGKTKYVLTIHDLALIKMSDVGTLKNVIIQKILMKKSVKKADKIISISESTKNDIVDILHTNKDKIEVVYPGGKKVNDYNLTEKQEEEIEKKYNLKKHKFLFFLSTIEPRKNIDTLIKAFEIIKNQENSDLRLILAGGLGWKYENTLKLIEESKYKDDIILTGYITEEEKKYFFDNAICFVYPSLYEGFGIPVLEALSLKQIVVTTNVSSIPEVGGDAAFYYDNVLDYNNLANTIQKVIKLTDEERNTYISKGIEQANKFSWKKCAEEVLYELKK